MKFPSPPLPKWYWKMSFQNRVRFCKYYWNPWWNVKNVFDRHMNMNGIRTLLEGVKFRLEYRLWAWKHNRESKNRTEIPKEAKAATPTRETR